MEIRPLTLEDQRALDAMQTNIEDDYVKAIFPYLLDGDHLFGAFEGDQMVGIAGYTILAEQYAILGRLRTDVRKRGKGIAKKLVQYVQQKAEEDPRSRWVGLVTQVDNHPALNVVDKLGLEHLSTVYYCKLNEKGKQALRQEGHEAKEEWQEIIHTEEKRNLLLQWKEKEKDLNVFPYEGYYPLPYEETLWSDSYLAACRCWVRNERFFMLMPDEKGEKYLHAKYLWNDSFEQPGLWPKMIEEAEKEERILWFDFSVQGFEQIPDPTYFDVDSPWKLYGKRLRKEEDDETSAPPHFSAVHSHSYSS